MNCYEHKDIEATAKCIDCKTDLCEQCAKANRRPICEPCMKVRIGIERKKSVENLITIGSPIIIMTIFLFIIYSDKIDGIRTGFLIGIGASIFVWGYSFLRKTFRSTVGIWGFLCFIGSFFIGLLIPVSLVVTIIKLFNIRKYAALFKKVKEDDESDIKDSKVSLWDCIASGIMGYDVTKEYCCPKCGANVTPSDKKCHNCGVGLRY